MSSGHAEGHMVRLKGSRVLQGCFIWMTLRGFPALRANVAGKEADFKILSDNRSASHNYFLMERFEAGLVLTGTEVKAARAGKVQLKEAYAAIERNEAWLVNAHISQYAYGNRENHPPVRNRKLLAAPAGDRQAAGQNARKGPVADSDQDLLEEGPDQVRGRSGARQETARQARDRTRRTAEAEARAAVRASKARQ